MVSFTERRGSTVKSLYDWAAIELLEADRLVRVASALVELQRIHIEQLEQAGEDSTSARIEFDSLVISLACCVEHRHRIRTVCNANGEPASAA
jgi:hypothetical protein